MRGPRETQIETDRRIIKDKISWLKKRLIKIDKQKNTQRKRRARLVRVSLVGYTNAGKSTIMNKLSKSDVLAENKLFANTGCSVVIAPYRNAERSIVGAIGVVGPRYMNYARIIPMGDYTSRALARVLGR